MRSTHTVQREKKLAQDELGVGAVTGKGCGGDHYGAGNGLFPELSSKLHEGTFL